MRQDSIFQYITGCILLLMVFSHSQSITAKASYTSVESVLNGMVVPQFDYQTKKPYVNFDREASESMDPATGALTLKQLDLHLPGRDGLDLNLTRVYSSTKADYFKKDLKVQYEGSVSTVLGYQIYFDKTHKTTNEKTTENGDFFFDEQDAQNIVAYYESEEVVESTFGKEYTVEARYEEETITTEGYEYYNQLLFQNYVNSRYGLGAGWSFGFSSIQIIHVGSDQYEYLHLSDGSVYTIKMTEDEDDSNLIEYKGTDVEIRLNQSYNSTQYTSKYVLEYESGKKLYFSESGLLLATQDRYGNEIQFEYTNDTFGTGHFYISKITDTIGRTLNFNYRVETDKYLLDVVLLEPNSIAEPNPEIHMSLHYEMIKQAIEIKHQTLDPYETDPVMTTMIFDVPRLYRYTDIRGLQTLYESDFVDNEFINTRFTFLDKSFHSDDSLNCQGASLLINRIEAPTLATVYEYKKIKRNLGTGGLSESFGVTNRYNLVREFDTASGETFFNDKKRINSTRFHYINDYSGFPIETNPYHLSEGFEYLTYRHVEYMPEGGEFINPESSIEGTKELLTFDHKHRLTKSRTLYKNKEESIYEVVNFDENYSKRPTLTKTYTKFSDNSFSEELFTETIYDPNGKVMSKTMPITKRQLYDPDLKEKYSVKYEYQDLYGLVTRISSFQNASTRVEELFSYRNDGRLLSQTDKNGQVISYDYHFTPFGAHSVMDKVTQTIQLENNLVGKTQTLFGSDTSYAYPSEVISFYTDNGEEKIRNTTYEYDLLLGKLKKSTLDGSTTENFYDGAGRLIKIQHPNYEDQIEGTISSSTHFEYYDHVLYTFDGIVYMGYADKTYTMMNSTQNPTPKKYNEKLTIYNGFGSFINSYKAEEGNFIPIESVVYENDATRPHRVNYSDQSMYFYLYDEIDRNHEVYDQDGNLYKTEFDEKNRISTTYFVPNHDLESFRENPLDRYKESVVKNYTDNFGRTIETRMYPNWPDQRRFISEKFFYELNGNVKGYVNPNKNTNEDGYTQTFFYDKNNRITKIKDALNQITKMNYTLSGAIESIELFENDQSATSIKLYTKEYNEINEMIAKIDNLNKSTNFTYNQRGLLEHSSDRNGNTFDYEFNEINQLKRQIITDTSSGETFEHVLEYASPFGVSRVQDIINGSLVGTKDIQYLDHGQVDSIEYQYGSSNYNHRQEYNYDIFDRLTKYATKVNQDNFLYTHYKFEGPKLKQIQVNGLDAESNSDEDHFTYEYYPNGLIQSIKYPEMPNGEVLESKYIYNKLNRLEKMVNMIGTRIVSEFNYKYDNNGNIIQKYENNQEIFFKYDKLNRLVEIRHTDGKVKFYNYDLRGNRQTLINTVDDSPILDAQYTYDVRNMLKSVTKNGVTTDFKYRLDGLRYQKTVGSNITQYHYNQAGKLIAETDGNQNTVANYIWDAGRALVQKNSSGNDYYYIYNGHGDVVQLIDTDGSVVNSYEYDTWGNITYSDETVHNPFKYAGEVFDVETGLSYNRARYYDPALGRFINEDTYEGQVVNPLSLNVYSYVHNNPLIYVDPTGRSIWSVSGNFLGGLWNGGKSAVVGTAEVVFNPIGTAKGVGSAVYNYDQTYQALLQLAIETGNTYDNGDADLKANYIGNGLGAIGGEILLAKGIGKLGKLAKASKYADDASDTAKVIKGVNKTFNFKSPNSRHYISKVTQKSTTKKVNTVIEPWVDVTDDIAKINAGKATRNGDLFTINNRTYGLHDGTLHPVSGKGFITLDRGGYNALGIYNKFGNTQQATTIINNMNISTTQRNLALKAWEAVNK
jgi:RHS repeat-associated protein